jgi:hypothetical protein
MTKRSLASLISRTFADESTRCAGMKWKTSFGRLGGRTTEL